MIFRSDSALGVGGRYRKVAGVQLFRKEAAVIDWLRENWIGAALVWLMLTTVFVTLWQAWLEASTVDPEPEPYVVGPQPVSDAEVERILGDAGIEATVTRLRPRDTDLPPAA